ncbi:MAG: hypothetical protein ACLP4V_23140 [Methylocella sp.]
MSAFTETLFMTVYGSPILQAMVGLGSDNVKVRRHIDREVIREAAAQRMAAEIEARVDRGGLCEAVVRALLYIGSALQYQQQTSVPLPCYGRFVPSTRRAGG